MSTKEVQRLDILFKDASATYKAGDVVSGFVQLDLSQELKLKALKIPFEASPGSEEYYSIHGSVVHWVQGIKVELLGMARVHWDEKRAYTKGSAAKLSHRNADSYLDEVFSIMNKADTLAPGRYNYPFIVRIPFYLPGSYEGQWGKVQYVAKAVLERPWKGDIEFSRTFTVLGMLDLNADSDAKKPLENIGEAMAGRGCCKTGPISGHLVLERRGVAVGQNLPFLARIDNQSSVKVNARVVLSQQATFRADKQVRKSSNVLKVMTKGDVKAGENITWEDELKSIPAVPPTKLGGGCKTIEVKYLLTLILVPSGPGNDLEVPVEVIIGTIPLRKTESSGQQMLTVKAAARRLSGGSLVNVKAASDTA